MSEIKFGYKVLRISKTKTLKSATVHGAETVYPCNEWVTPHEDNGPLAIFAAYDNADMFVRLEACRRAYGFTLRREPFVIFKCAYTPSEYNAMWVYDGIMYEQRSLSNCPPSTVLADSVLLLAEVTSC